MKYQINNEFITPDIIRKLKLIESGKTGKIYKWKNNKILKIFSNNSPNDRCPMDLETAEILSKINLESKCIILPIDLVFNKNDSERKNLKGYTSQNVEKKGNKNITRMPKKKLIHNIEEIEEDIELLSRKNILLNGLNADNSIFNGYLYISNPVKYLKLEEETVRNINMKLLQHLLIDLITRDLRKLKVQKQKIEQVAELLFLKDDDVLNSIYLKDILDTPIYTDNIDNVFMLTKKL